METIILAERVRKIERLRQSGTRTCAVVARGYP